MTGRHIAVGTPTQVAHPWKAAVRTAAAYVAGAVLVLIVAIPVVNDVMGEYLPDAWEAWLTAAAAFLGALVTLVTRLMALPQLQDFLERLGLGTGVENERVG